MKTRTSKSSRVRRSALPRVARVERLEERCLLASAAFNLIGLTQLRADPAFAGINGSGVSVAVIDSGVDFSHPALQSSLVYSYDFVRNQQPAQFFPSDHGTHVAGIVGARNNDIGVAPDVGIIGLQVFSPVPGQSQPLARNDHILAALQWVLNNRAQYNIVAVNMSLGGGFHTSQAAAHGAGYEVIIRQLEAAGVTVVAAAGNAYGLHFNRQTGQVFNAMFPNSGSPGILSTINVGAVWETNEGQQIVGAAIDVSTAADRVTGFTQRPPLDVGNVLFAPGALINSTVFNGRFEEKPGTSMASPMVAGAVALLQEAAMQFGGRWLSPIEVRNILQQTADSVFDGDDEQNFAFVDLNGDFTISQDELRTFQHTNLNYPRLNVYNAVRAVRDMFGQIGQPNPGDPGAPATGDPNGVIAGAFLGPTLTGAPVPPVLGTIGVDGGVTNVGPTDVDIIRFEMTIPGEVTLETKSLQSAPADFDTYLRLFDHLGNQLAFDDDGGVGLFSRISINLPVGVYYVGVSSFQNRTYDPHSTAGRTPGETGNFELHFTLASGDPNGTIAGAVTVMPAGGGEPEILGGSIGFDYGQPVGPADVDMFRIVAPDDGLLLIDIDTPFTSGYVDSFLRIFDAQGNQVAFSDDDLSLDFNLQPNEFTDFFFPGLVFEHPIDRTFFHGHTTDSFAYGFVQRGDVYYVGVSDFHNQNYNPHNLAGRSAAGSGGLYNLKISFSNGDVNGSIPQAVDATMITLPLIDHPGIIGADGTPTGLRNVGDRDVDFIRLRIDQDGVLEVDIDSYSRPDIISDPVDTVLYLYDPAGQLLAGNDDHDGLDPLLRYPVRAGEEYLVAVVGYGNHDFDPFRLASGTPGDMGEYRFSARLLPPQAESEDANDRITDGGLPILSAGMSAFDHIGRDGALVRGDTDVDLFRFDAPANGVLSLSSLPIDAFSSGTALRVFNAGGSQLASTLFGVDGLSLEVTAGATYYIGVTGPGPGATQYSLFSGATSAGGLMGGFELVLDRLQPLRRLWNNSVERFDVNNDGIVSLGDLVVIINRLRTGADPILPNRTGLLESEPFFDVNNDGLSTLGDAVALVNALRALRDGGEGEPGVGPDVLLAASAAATDAGAALLADDDVFDATADESDAAGSVDRAVLELTTESSGTTSRGERWLPAGAPIWSHNLLDALAADLGDG